MPTLGSKVFEWASFSSIFERWLERTLGGWQGKFAEFNVGFRARRRAPSC